MRRTDTRDVAGWVLPLIGLAVSVPVALGRSFGLQVEPLQGALASGFAALALLLLASSGHSQLNPAMPSNSEPFASS